MAATITPYVAALRDPRWQRKRLEIMERDGFRCRECKTNDVELQVHHKRYKRNAKPWEHEDSIMVTLCRPCHERITELHDRAKFLLGEMNLYELPIAVAMLEGFWEKDGAGFAPPQSDVSLSAAVYRELQRINAERDSIPLQPFTTEASRRLDHLDARVEELWDMLAGQA